MATAAVLDFWNHDILLAIVVQMVKTHQRAKFRQNWSIGCADIKIFRFFKMAAAPIFWFLNLWIYCNFSNFRDGHRHHHRFLKSRNFMGYRGVEDKMHQRAKFRQNLSIICEDINIFLFFQMVAVAIFDFQICKIYWLMLSSRPRRITVPNFAKIGLSVAQILRFFEFSRWPPLFLKSGNFIG